MVDDTDFTPRLGKLRDVGAGSSKRFRARVLKVAKGLHRKPTRPGFTGARIGRGSAAGGRRTSMRPHIYPRDVISLRNGRSLSAGFEQATLVIDDRLNDFIESKGGSIVDELLDP